MNLDVNWNDRVFALIVKSSWMQEAAFILHIRVDGKNDKNLF